MTEDERQRQMDFILNNQAQFSADIQKLQEEQAKLQEGQAKLQESHAKLLESQSTLLEIQVEATQVVKRLAAVTLEGFKQTDSKIDALIDAQMRTDGSVIKIAEAQTKFAEAQAKLAEAQAELAEAQTHTEQRLDALIDIVREGRNGKP